MAKPKATTEHKAQGYKQDLAELHVKPMRKCFTCGASTYNFECNKCKANRHAKGY